jgi:hypothetical protein
MNGQSGPSTATSMVEGGLDSAQIGIMTQLMKNEDEDFEFEEATVE